MAVSTVIHKHAVLDALVMTPLLSLMELYGRSKQTIKQRIYSNRTETGYLQEADSSLVLGWMF